MRRPEIRLRPDTCLIAAVLVACWPVWQWLWLRFTDASEEPWEIVSLLTALAFVSQASAPASARPRLGLPLALLLLYAAGYAWLPPLPRATLAFSAIAATLSTLRFGTRLHLPLWGLLLLSLPLIASLNFYLGYPLRVFTGTATAMLLQTNGLAVVRDGALLLWNGQSIAIDAPCSGIKMLWTGGYLCCALAAFQGMRPGRTLLLGLAAFAVVLLANILRASALFYMEAGILPLPPAAHTGIGIAAFIVTAALIAALAHWLDKPSASLRHAPH